MSLVTVLLPVYNGGPFLPRVLASLLAQTWRDFEVLVIDDGSSDGSAEIAAAHARSDPRVRVLRNERNLGLARTLNRGLDEARSPLVARQDVDDLSHPERLARQVAFLEAHAEVALVGAQGWEIDRDERRVGLFDKPCEPDGIDWTMMVDNAFIHTSVLFRREAVAAAGGYDPAYEYCQDYELWSRLLRTRRGANLRERLVSCRLHPGSMTETIQKDHRHQSVEVMAREQQAHLGQARPPSDLELLAQIRGGVPAAQKPRVLAVLREMQDAFVQRRPQALRSRDFRRTLARQYGNVLAAYRFRPLSLMLPAAAQAGLRYPVLPTLVRRAWWAARKRLAGLSAPSTDPARQTRV